MISQKFNLSSLIRNVKDCSCTSMVTPNEIYINNSDNFNVSMRIFTETGDIPQTPVAFTMRLYSKTFIDYLLDVPSYLANLSSSSPDEVTNDNLGFVNFSNARVKLVLYYDIIV